MQKQEKEKMKLVAVAIGAFVLYSTALIASFLVAGPFGPLALIEFLAGE